MSTAESIRADREDSRREALRTEPPDGLIRRDDFTDVAHARVHELLKCIAPLVAQWGGSPCIDVDLDRGVIGIEVDVQDMNQWEHVAWANGIVGACLDPADWCDIRPELAGQLETLAAALRLAVGGK